MTDKENIKKKLIIGAAKELDRLKIDYAIKKTTEDQFYLQIDFNDKKYDIEIITKSYKGIIDGQKKSEH